MMRIVLKTSCVSGDGPHKPGDEVEWDDTSAGNYIALGWAVAAQGEVETAAAAQEVETAAVAPAAEVAVLPKPRRRTRAE